MSSLGDHRYTFMARRAIPMMIAFPRVRCMFIIIYILVSLTRVCVVYVVKEVTSFGGGLGQLMGVARNGTRSQALTLSCLKHNSLYYFDYLLSLPFKDLLELISGRIASYQFQLLHKLVKLQLSFCYSVELQP